jgi:histidinol-phosphate aminotransferase
MNGPRAKASIAAIAPYVPGRAQAAGFAQPIKLSANENALGASPAARAAYLRAVPDLHLYPDPRASALRAAIAEKYSIEPERILFGTGSDEIFSMLCQAYLNPGDNMVQPQFAFAAWAIAARAAGGEVKSAPERGYAVDVDAMLRTVDERTRIVFLANPANPTGTCIPYADVERLHANLPSHVLLVLDNAYAEFARARADFNDGTELARRFANVIVTRTFSKLYGLAALRIGWAYASATLLEPLQRIRLPFNTAHPAQAAAIAALADEAFCEASLAHAEAGRAELAHMLTGFGLEPLPSATNFVTARFPASHRRSPLEIERGLAEHGILVRGLTNYGMPDCLRVTVGTHEQMARLAEVMQMLFGEA